MAHFMKVPVEGMGEAFVNIEAVQYVVPISQGNYSQCVIVFGDGQRLIGSVGHAVFAEFANEKRKSV